MLQQPTIKSLIFVISLLTIIPSVHAKKRIKYGQVSMDELTMKVYEKDTSARAVILYDYGYFRANEYTFSRHTRIKILKKEGYFIVTRAFYGRSKSTVRGITFNLEDGKVISDKLRSESIFQEKIIDDFFITRITMPNVKVGSVVDIYVTYDALPLQWYFQEVVPVKYSELIIENDPYIIYNKKLYGHERLHVNEEGRWIGKDIPAFRREPYMSSNENFISKLDLEIMQFRFPRYYAKSFHQIPFNYQIYSLSTSWEAINHNLLTSFYFGERLKGNAFLNEIAEKIAQQNTNQERKARLAFDHVQSGLRWNGRSFIQATNEQSYVYNKKAGNVAEINLTLISLLRKVGIEVYPVVLSTRSNGMIDPGFPSLFKLNYVIAYAKIDGEEYFLDATEPYLAFRELPERCLNGLALIIDENKSGWINLNAAIKKKLPYMLT